MRNKRSNGFDLKTLKLAVLFLRDNKKAFFIVMALWPLWTWQDFSFLKYYFGAYLGEEKKTFAKENAFKIRPESSFLHRDGESISFYFHHTVDVYGPHGDCFFRQKKAGKLKWIS